MVSTPRARLRLAIACLSATGVAQTRALSPALCSSATRSSKRASDVSWLRPCQRRPLAQAPATIVARPQGRHGEWRSLVAHLTGGQEVAGSNPASPTRKQRRSGRSAAAGSRFGRLRGRLRAREEHGEPAFSYMYRLAPVIASSELTSRKQLNRATDRSARQTLRRVVIVRLFDAQAFRGRRRSAPRPVSPRATSSARLNARPPAHSDPSASHPTRLTTAESLVVLSERPQTQVGRYSHSRGRAVRAAGSGIGSISDWYGG